jgi:hypothetical protein
MSLAVRRRLAAPKVDDFGFKPCGSRATGSAEVITSMATLSAPQPERFPHRRRLRATPAVLRWGSRLPTGSRSALLLRGFGVSGRPEASWGRDSLRWPASSLSQQSPACFPMTRTCPESPPDGRERSPSITPTDVDMPPGSMAGAAIHIYFRDEHRPVRLWRRRGLATQEPIRHCARRSYRHRLVAREAATVMSGCNSRAVPGHLPDEARRR